MSYVVGNRTQPEHSFEERKNLDREGTFRAKIAYAGIKEVSLDPNKAGDKAMIDTFGTNFKKSQITIKFEIGDDLQQWLNIFQTFNKETFSVEYQGWVLDMVSKGVGIDEGTNFASIENWVDYIRDKEVEIVVKQKGDWFNIDDILPVELAF